MHPPREERPSFAAKVGALFAWALPVAVALARTSASPQWRGDVGAVRDLALGGIEWGGGVSTALAQMFAIVPLGSRTFRASVVSVLALGVLARALYAVVLAHLRGLEREAGRAPSTWGAPWLAAIAAMSAAMTPTVQEEATVGGGGLVAAAIATTLLRGLQRAVQEGVSGASAGKLLAAVATGLGLLASERVELAGLVTLAILVGFVTLRVAGARDVRILVPRRWAALAVATLVVGFVAGSLPAALRLATPLRALTAAWRSSPLPTTSALASSQLSLGVGTWGPSIAPANPTLSASLLETATNELGTVALLGALVGALALASRRRTRPFTLALVALVVTDAFASGWLGSSGSWGGEPALACRLVSLAALASCSTAGLFVLLDTLIAKRIPLAKQAAAMILAFHATSVALVVEQADARADRSVLSGADAFTRAALDALPPGSTLWVDDPSAAWRLLAAQLVEGRRPDVLVVPRRLVLAGELLPPLLERERSLTSLLRSVALSGATDELAMSEIADRRPLFVEPERAWEPGMYEHLGVSHAWSRFHPEPRGAVERASDIAQSERTLGRLLRDTAGEEGDGRTASAVAAVLRAQAKTLLRSGEPDAARRWLARGESPRATQLASTGSLDVLFAGAVARLSLARDRTEGANPRRAVAARAR